MPDINLVDTSLKNYNTHTEISIQLSLNGFSFCIYSVPDNVIRAFRSYKFRDVILQEDLVNETEKIMQRDELLRLQHQKARIIYFERKSTLIPFEFGEDEHLKQLLQFNHPLDELDEIHQHSIEACLSKLIFTIPSYIASLFTKKFKDCKFYNQASPFLTTLLNSTNNKTVVYLQLNKDFVDIAVIIEGKLQLYNSFLYVSETDLLYFVVYVCKQVNLDPKFVKFFYMGENANVPQLEKELTQFLPNAKRIENVFHTHISSKVRIPNPFRYFSLLNLASCE